MKKDKINVLFVCGYGMGSSAISEVVVSKALRELNIPCEVKHTALGEMPSYYNWADILAISKKLTAGISVPENLHMIEVVNIMDGKTIAAQIEEVAKTYYSEVLEINKRE